MVTSQRREREAIGRRSQAVYLVLTPRRRPAYDARLDLGGGDEKVLGTMKVAAPAGPPRVRAGRTAASVGLRVALNSRARNFLLFD
jgi:hypothetical protein